jgi:hypothetical protein
MHTSQAPERRLVRPAAFLAALSAIGLTFTLMVGPALGVTYATVTGHEPHSDEANAESFWEARFPGSDCDKPEGVQYPAEFVLPAPPAGLEYVAVIVKTGSGEFANTIFAAPPSEGETVFADTNGNSMPDDGDQDSISHIVFCYGEAEESVEASVEESEEPPSVEESASAEASVEESVEASVEESVEASVEESVEGSVEASAEGSVEGSVKGGTGTPEPSTPDTAFGGANGPSPLPTIVFGGILLASLAGLAWVNVQAVRTRS